MGKAGDFVLSKHLGGTVKVEKKSGWQKGLAAACGMSRVAKMSRESREPGGG